jgi:hypothetical protein
MDKDTYPLATKRIERMLDVIVDETKTIRQMLHDPISTKGV